MRLESPDGCLLDVEFYQLFDAVKDDDVAAVSAILLQDQKLKEQVLHGSFEMPSLDHGPFQEDLQFALHFNLSRMWHLAVSFHSVGVMQLFLQEGVDVLQKDEHQNNTLHVLATGAFFCPHHEQRTIVKSYLSLCSLLPPDALRTLHFSTNDQGVRPLELAASFGTMHLLGAMMQTQGIYLAFSQPYGMYEICWYDITEYENDRSFMSPLAGLMTIEEEKIANSKVHEVCESVVVQHWLSMKKRSLRRCMALSVLGRILFATMFVLFMLARCSVQLEKFHLANEICPSTSFAPWFIYALEAVLCCASLIHIFIDAMEFYIFNYSKKFSYLMNNPKGRKKCAINFGYYRVIDGVMAVSTLTYTVTSAFTLRAASDGRATASEGATVTLMQLNFAVAMITISWSMLHFLQLHCHVGVFIMCLQRMFTDLSHFLIVLVLICLPFVYSFSSIVYEDIALAHAAHSRASNPSGFNPSGFNPSASNSSTPLPNPYFRSLWKSHYTVFTVILNMVNFDQIGIRNNHALYFLHTAFVMIVVILLLNLLIAKFSSSVAFVTENQGVLLTAQTLAVMWMFECRYKWLLPSALFRRLRCDTFPSMDGRLYVRDIKIRNRKSKETHV